MNNVGANIFHGDGAVRTGIYCLRSEVNWSGRDRDLIARAK
jgi:hypothetical protein